MKSFSIARIFKEKSPYSMPDFINNRECNQLLETIKETYGEDMTGLIVIVERKKETEWRCAGMEPAQAILSLDQLHHRIQHEGIQGYD